MLWRCKKQEIRTGDVVLFHTGWGTHYTQTRSFSYKHNQELVWK